MFTVIMTGMSSNADNKSGSLPDTEKAPLIGEVKVKDAIINKKCFRKCSIVMEVLMVIYMLVYFPTRTLIPEYTQHRAYEELTGQTTYNETRSRCLSNNATIDNDPVKANLTLASSAASYFDLEMSLASGIPALVITMFLGPFSDRAGRRFALWPPLIGQVISVGMCAVTAFFHLPVQVILVGYFIYGCCGLNISFYLASFAFIADTTTTAKRSFRIVLSYLGMVIAAIISSVSTGYLVDNIGFEWVFFMLFVLSIIALVYGVCLVPETVQRDPEAKFFTLIYLKKSITVIMIDDESKRRWKLIAILGTMFTGFIMGANTSPIETLFALNQPLCWSVTLIGIYSSARHGMQIVGCGLIVWIFKAYVKDSWLLVLSAACLLTANVFRYFVTTTGMMFGAAAIDFAAPFYTANSRALLTKLVKPDEIGSILGGMAILELLTELLSHAITNPLYSINALAGHPSAVFLYMAGGYAVSLTIIMVFAIRTRHDKSGQDSK